MASCVQKWPVATGRMLSGYHTIPYGAILTITYDNASKTLFAYVLCDQANAHVRQTVYIVMTDEALPPEVAKWWRYVGSVLATIQHVDQATTSYEYHVFAGEPPVAQEVAG